MVSLPATVVTVSLVTVWPVADSFLPSSSSLSELLEEELSDATSGAFLATHTLHTHAREQERKLTGQLFTGVREQEAMVLLLRHYLNLVVMETLFYYLNKHAADTYGSGLLWCCQRHWSLSPQESCIWGLFQSWGTWAKQMRKIEENTVLLTNYTNTGTEI